MPSISILFFLLFATFAQHIRAQLRSYPNPGFNDTTKSSHPLHFSNIIPCKSYLLHQYYSQIPSIIYNWGIEDSQAHSGAKLLECLTGNTTDRSGKYARAIKAQGFVTDIIVAFPVLTPVPRDADPEYGKGRDLRLLDSITTLLPSVTSIRFPCRPTGWDTRQAWRKRYPDKAGLVGNKGCYEVFGDVAFTPSVECAEKEATLSVHFGRYVVETKIERLWGSDESGLPMTDEKRRQGVKTNIKRWKEAMDWSKLKTLNIERPPEIFLRAFKAHLHGLESLTIVPSHEWGGAPSTLCGTDPTTQDLRREYVEFVTSTGPLKELRIIGMGEPLDMTAILAAHGQTITTLSLHDFEIAACSENLVGQRRTLSDQWVPYMIALEGPGPYSSTASLSYRRKYLSPTDLEHIRLSAPHLQTLEIDVLRNADGTLPAAIIAELAQFPSLENLTLHLNLFSHHGKKLSNFCLSHVFSKKTPDYEIDSLVLKHPECNIPAPLLPFPDPYLDIPHDFSVFRDGPLKYLNINLGDDNEGNSRWKQLSTYEGARPGRFECTWSDMVEGQEGSQWLDCSKGHQAEVWEDYWYQRRWNRRPGDEPPIAWED
ncbi:hypothetical protein EJ04DRAFT_553964 [Polyplosphaeria fusca]|uniref:Uncharacterized protein n=1 Tax=Polyplosphaeria fusca TaxID=682080 RepID=A0A9P4UXW0_9PLEO|nr:hypothetical protein EJ04DRAFT_553964 [Polyplosphaeria fusca]